MLILPGLWKKEILGQSSNQGGLLDPPPLPPEAEITYFSYSVSLEIEDNHDNPQTPTESIGQLIFAIIMIICTELCVNQPPIQHLS